MYTTLRTSVVLGYFNILKSVIYVLLHRGKLYYKNRFGEEKFGEFVYVVLYF